MSLSHDTITIILVVWLVLGMIWLFWAVHSVKGQKYDGHKDMQFTVAAFFALLLPFMLSLYHFFPMPERSTLRHDVDACLAEHRVATVENGKVVKCSNDLEGDK